MDQVLLITIILFIITFIIRIPVAIGMILTSIFYFNAKGQDISLVADTILSNLMSTYVILVVPLFIFTAAVMNTGLVTDKIFSFANALVGRYKGGMGHVNVVASCVFSGMSGSAVADASGLGKMEIESMRRQGYDDGFSSAITAASSTIGPIFPPSIPMVIYAMLSGASVGALFIAGIIPGLLLAVALMIYIVFVARKRDYPSGPRYTFKKFVIFTFQAFPALLTPVILLIGIYSGIITPTEAGAAAALYALLVSVIVYRTMGVNQLKDVFKDTVVTTGNLGLIVGAAYCFSYIVAYEQIPAVISDFMLDFTDNKYVMLLIINIFFLIMGMFVDTMVMTLVFIPMVLPFIDALGIDPVHFGVLIVLNMMIGLSTPPFGMLLFIVSGIAKIPINKVIKEVWPMILVMLFVLGLVTYIPEISLFLPNILE
ncbi:TRAP transporter large permease [Aquisalibacillus elongatus]|uniref:Tripartite ATP-independent transporter DctM subunit n=1 Tax=Aquisalibacillus elongatus TaxID=485577 RepID=A0A3N5B9U3_9BACI|nr:TRAP transporter large permease [Aquisalibacillus elongatus]RPF54244.1 tripartite ATP-independent transporter DctM subunit [Aquisalibacillus elongatus]